MIKVITYLYNKIRDPGEWPSSWSQFLIICLHKKGNIQHYENYRTISFISHISKIILKVILRRFQPISEELMSEEQAGVRGERSINEHILNLRIISEK